MLFLFVCFVVVVFFGGGVVTNTVLYIHWLTATNNVLHIITTYLLLAKQLQLILIKSSLYTLLTEFLWTERQPTESTPILYYLLTVKVLLVHVEITRFHGFLLCEKQRKLWRSVWHMYPVLRQCPWRQVWYDELPCTGRGLSAARTSVHSGPMQNHLTLI